MSVKGGEHFKDLGQLSGVSVPAVLSGIPQSIGGEGLTMPLHWVPLEQISRRRAQLRQDTLMHVDQAAEFLRATMKWMYPDATLSEPSDGYLYRKAVGGIFDIKRPSRIVTGHLEAYTLEAVGLTDFDEELQDQLMPHPGSDTSPAEALFLIASATIHSGRTTGRLGNLVQIRLPGVHDGVQPVRFGYFPVVTHHSIALDRQRVTADARTTRAIGVAVEAVHRAQATPSGLPGSKR